MLLLLSMESKFVSNLASHWPGTQLRSSTPTTSSFTTTNSEEIIFVTPKNRVVRTNINGTIVHWGKQFPAETPVLTVLHTTFNNKTSGTSLCILMAESVYIQANDGTIFNVQLPSRMSKMWSTKGGLIFQKDTEETFISSSNNNSSTNTSSISNSNAMHDTNGTHSSNTVGGMSSSNNTNNISLGMGSPHLSELSGMEGVDEPFGTPIFYSLTDPNEELKPIGSLGDDDFFCDSNERLIHCFHEHSLAVTYNDFSHSTTIWWLHREQTDPSIDLFSDATHNANNNNSNNNNSNNNNSNNSMSSILSPQQQHSQQQQQQQQVSI